MIAIQNTAIYSFSPFSNGLQSFRSNLLQRGLSRGAAGQSAPAPGAPPLPPSLTLVLALLFLFFFFFFFPPPLSVQCFLTFLKYVFAEVSLAWLMGLAVAGGVLLHGWFWLAQSSPPFSIPLSTPCHLHPIQPCNFFSKNLFSLLAAHLGSPAQG